MRGTIMAELIQTKVYIVTLLVDAVIRGL